MEILTSVRRAHKGAHRAVWTDADTEIDRVEMVDGKRAGHLRAQLWRHKGRGSFVSALLNLQLIEEELSAKL